MLWAGRDGSEGELSTQNGRSALAEIGRLWSAMKQLSDQNQNVVSTTASGNRVGYVPVDSLPGVRIRSSPVFDRSRGPES